MIQVIDPKGLAIIGGCLPILGGIIGSVLGMGIACPAGVACLAEDPSQFRNVIVLASMPITQTFYGLVATIIIFTSAVPQMPETGGMGLAVVGIGFLTGAAELFSATWQGIIDASGIALLPKTKGRIFTHSFLLAIYCELPGTLGIVWTIILLSLLGLMG
jgi:V/A-type H+-transporting ATPase subunit K